MSCTLSLLSVMDTGIMSHRIYRNIMSVSGYRPLPKKSCGVGIRPSLTANLFQKLEMQVSTPSQADLTRETGESGSLSLKCLQPFRERHPTPLAISSGYHFEKLSTLSIFPQMSFGRDLFEKKAPFRMKRPYTLHTTHYTLHSSK